MDIQTDGHRLFLAARDTLFCYDTLGNLEWKVVPNHVAGIITYNPYNQTLAVAEWSYKYDQDVWFYSTNGEFITHTSLISVIASQRDSIVDLYSSIGYIFPRPDCGWLMQGAYRDTITNEQHTFIMRTNPWGTLDPTGFCRPPQPPVTGWQLYPNPSADHVTLEAPDGTTPWQVQVYDMAGRLVYAPPTLNFDKLELNIAEWPEGVYGVIALSEDQHSVLFVGKMIR